MEWIIAIAVIVVIAGIAFAVARRGGKGGETPAAGERHRADPGERDDVGPPAGPEPDEDLEPPRDRPPGDRFD